MTAQLIEKILKEIAASKLLVVGDLILDNYIWGKTSRISPEAPVQVVEVERDELRLGGAGNVVNNLQALGCRVAVASVVGDDDDGRKLLELFERQGVDVAGVLQAKQRTTSRKSRVLASQQQMLRIDRESTEEISAGEQSQLFAFIKQQLPEVGAVLLSDYLKGVLAPELLQQIIELCRKQNIPVIVDPKGTDFSRYRGATLLTPNRREAEVATGVVIRDQASLLQAGEKLLNEQQLDALVLTRSEEGMSLFTETGVEHLPTEAREVFDVSGAGDTVVALIGAALGVGAELNDAAQLANLAAGIVVGKLGTSTVTAPEIINSYSRRHSLADGKILPRKELASLLDPLRSNGKKIVFTNGCFDLLHAGHVKYLQQARQLGDLLVLGLNSDSSIRRLKGEKRPLLEESERAQILAALDCIDYLSIFDEDTPLELLQLVRPQILVKGGDYLPDEVVGKELVESYGGRVELIQFVDGKSTTNIIDKVLSRYRDGE
ncbi:D-alpha,beta-D-heptose 7-phosphate 1-kinase [Malonomonas rubra DSM 5091]|uniref:Bifunctional protein HldE n=1 Tax=Malonomonas rubra DSM 5091 TaxID=1122189 RepID=A0A1M6C6T2_MALRU|nr:bifunctional D-glycero-beta-D-manno-heptose-7-phosphate kinase/D-glycero-beta-D-manno-heptose 1-phosphate adenylyltransferase HldE [Malonomonas rubra]SHI56663.1 D-alpha,beta-D-heptose 7-phosphate 1-kinase [Malonomonas rubra DSM 5091]